MDGSEMHNGLKAHSASIYDHRNTTGIYTQEALKYTLPAGEQLEGDL